MHFNIRYNVRILYETLLHVSAPWCHPQGAVRSLLKLHIRIILQNVVVKTESWLKLIKLIKTARLSPRQTGTTATSQPLHIQPAPTTLAVFISFINFNQLSILTITFCKIILVCNFSKERRAPEDGSKVPKHVAAFHIIYEHGNWC